VRRGWLLGLVLLLFAPAVQGAHVAQVTIEGAITSASYEYLRQALEQSEKERAAALLVELDTPGGVVSATQQIVQLILNAKVPVIVYVAPQGAWAASAGTFITVSAHVAAMSPGSSIGAASPITMGGDSGGGRDEEGERTDVAMQKAEKLIAAFMESVAKERDRNVEWVRKSIEEAEAITADEALELGVIEFVARDRADLFEQMQGYEVEVAGEAVTLELKDLPVRPVEMNLITRLLTFIAQPEITAILVLLGMAGLYMEVQQPGMIVPGVLGLTCLVLAGIAFQILPFSWIGLLLMVVGVGLMLTELFVTSYGLLIGAGAICLLLGGSMLFDVPEVTGISIPFWGLLVPVVGTFAGVAALVIYALGNSMRRAQASGVSELVGLVGRATTGLAPEGKVFVRGEYWNASAEDEIESGESVEITAVDGLRLRVRRADESS
jgi:membrane-bound serine protease (ClpP class)